MCMLEADFYLFLNMIGDVVKPLAENQIEILATEGPVLWQRFVEEGVWCMMP